MNRDDRFEHVLTRIAMLHTYGEILQKEAELLHRLVSDLDPSQGRLDLDGRTGAESAAGASRPPEDRQWDRPAPDVRRGKPGDSDNK